MNISDFLNSIRIGAQLAVGEQPKCPPGYCARLATCPDYRCPGHPGPTGEPITTPERAEAWTGWALYALLAFASGCAALAWIAFNR